MFARLTSVTTKVPRVFNNLRQMSEYTRTPEKCLNSVQLLGRVGQDPVTRGENYRFVTFDLATSKQFPKKTPDGGIEYKTETQWHSINVFRPHLIERVTALIQKGTRLMITGSIEYRQFEKEDGKTVEYTKIVPDDIIVLSSKKES